MTAAANPPRASRVPALSITELEQLYTLRIAVECVAIRISVPRFDDTDFERLEALARRLEERAAADDVDGWEGPHREFHERLIAYAGDEVTGLASRLQESAKRYRRMYVSQAARAWWHMTAEHALILRACRERDPSAAAAQLGRHYARTALTVIALIDPQHDPASVRAAASLVVPRQPEWDTPALGRESPRTAARPGALRSMA